MICVSSERQILITFSWTSVHEEPKTYFECKMSLFYIFQNDSQGCQNFKDTFVCNSWRWNAASVYFIKILLKFKSYANYVVSLLCGYLHKDFIYRNDRIIKLTSKRIFSILFPVIVIIFMKFYQTVKFLCLNIKSKSYIQNSYWEEEAFWYSQNK